MSSSLEAIARRLPPLLIDRTFRQFWLGQTVSLFGDQISFFAIPIVAVLALRADATEMGYLTAAATLPNLLFALHAGAWVDRRGQRRKTMIVADLARASLLITVPVAYVLGLLTLAQLYIVAFLIGSFDVLFNVANSTLFVSIVRAQDYLQGNSLLQGSRAFSSVAGQSIAGLLVAVLTAPISLLADALSFLASAFFLGSIRPEEPATVDAASLSVTTGIRFILRSQVVRATLAASATANYFTFVFSALFMLYAVRTLDVRPAVLGLILGAGAVGSLAGSFLTSKVSHWIGVGRTFVLGCFLFPAALLLVPAAAGHGVNRLILLFLAEFGSGLGVMIFDISVGTIRATVTPASIRATVAGAYSMVNYGVRPFGALTGGVLAPWLGLRPTLWIAAIGGTACVLWTVFSPLIRPGFEPVVEEIPR